MLEKRNSFNLGVICVSARKEENLPLRYTVSGYHDFFSVINTADGYDTMRLLQEKTIGKAFYDDIYWDPESGCFFAYCNSPKTVKLLVKTMSSLSARPIDKARWSKFKLFLLMTRFGLDLKS